MVMKGTKRLIVACIIKITIIFSDERGKFPSLFDLSYDKDASKSAVRTI